MPRTFIAAVLAVLTLAFALPSIARADDDKPIKAHFICGGCCHDYLHQREIIPKGISARANVEWTIAYDSDKGTKKLNPVYDNPNWYKGFDVIIHDECDADVKDLNVINNTILKPHKDGLPGVVLHCGMHCYRSEGWPKVDDPVVRVPDFKAPGIAPGSRSRSLLLTRKAQSRKGWKIGRRSTRNFTTTSPATFWKRLIPWPAANKAILKRTASRTISTTSSSGPIFTTAKQGFRHNHRS